MQGLLVDLSKKAMISGNYKELDDTIRLKIPKYLYNGGAGKWIHCIHLVETLLCSSVFSFYRKSAAMVSD